MEKPKFTEKRERTSWNIAAQQAMHISNLLVKAAGQQSRFELIPWRMTLIIIRESINYGLKPNERQELDRMEYDIANLKIKKESTDPFRESLDKQTNQKLYYALRDYQRKLMDLLNELGFFPSKEDRTKLAF
jgi:hypothetical protein